MSAHAPDRKWGFVLAALLALAVVQARAGDEGWKAGMPLPDLAGFGLEGALPSLANNVVVLDFWASWCGPCRVSFPVLEELHKKYAARGVILIGVNLDKDAGKIAPFLKTYPATFPIVRDAGQRLVKAANIQAMPTTVIVGRDGVIRDIHTGFNLQDGPTRLTAAIESALGRGGS